MIEYKPVTLAENPDLYKKFTLHNALFVYDLCVSETRKKFYFPYAIGAYKNNQLIGLAVATYAMSTKMAALESILVLKEERRKGIGRKLLEHLENLLIANGTLSISVEYTLNEESRDFSSLLKKQSWNSPYVYMNRFVFDSYTFDAPWLYQHPLLNPNLQIFEWKEINESEKRILKIQHDQYSFPRQISPLTREEIIEPSNSFGIRDLNQQRVIGWMLTYRMAPDWLRYEKIYVEEKYRPSGLFIILLSKAILRQIESKIHWAEFLLNIEEVEDRWMKFVLKRLVPLAIAKNQIMWSTKALIKEGV